jgi:hypothetical protein
MNLRTGIKYYFGFNSSSIFIIWSALGLSETLGLGMETGWELEIWEILAEFLFLLVNDHLSKLYLNDPP